MTDRPNAHLSRSEYRDAYHKAESRIQALEAALREIYALVDHHSEPEDEFSDGYLGGLMAAAVIAARALGEEKA